MIVYRHQTLESRAIGVLPANGTECSLGLNGILSDHLSKYGWLSEYEHLPSLYIQHPKQVL